MYDIFWDKTGSIGGFSAEHLYTMHRGVIFVERKLGEMPNADLFFGHLPNLIRDGDLAPFTKLGGG